MSQAYHTNAAYAGAAAAKTVVKDFQSILTELGWPEAARTVVAVRQPCVTFQVRTLRQQLHPTNSLLGSTHHCQPQSLAA
jgi:hypothetical protein